MHLDLTLSFACRLLGDSENHLQRYNDERSSLAGKKRLRTELHRDNLEVFRQSLKEIPHGVFHDRIAAPSSSSATPCVFSIM